MKKTLLSFFLIASMTAFSQGAGTNGAIQLTTGFTIDLDISSVTNKTRLTLVGPADRWLAVGFGIRKGASPSTQADPKA